MRKPEIWDHQKHLDRAFSKRGISFGSMPLDIKPSLKRVYTGDKVMTPMGKGRVALIDEDDVVCVDIDKDSPVLYEFDRAQVSIYKGKKKKGRK
jgi:hypothetical protein